MSQLTFCVFRTTVLLCSFFVCLGFATRSTYATTMEVTPDQIELNFVTSGNSEIKNKAVADRDVIEVKVKNLGYTYFEFMPKTKEQSIKALLMAQEIEAARNTHRHLTFTIDEAETIKPQSKSLDLGTKNRYLWLDSGQSVVGVKPDDIEISYNSKDGSLTYLIGKKAYYTENFFWGASARSRKSNLDKIISSAKKSHSTVRFGVSTDGKLALFRAEPYQVKPYRNDLASEEQKLQPTKIPPEITSAHQVPQ